MIDNDINADIEKSYFVYRKYTIIDIIINNLIIFYRNHNLFKKLHIRRGDVPFNEEHVSILLLPSLSLA